MAQSLDNKGNVIVDGFSTNLNPTQYASQNNSASATIPSAISASNLSAPQSSINVAQPNYNINQYQNTANSSQAYTSSALADEQRIAEQNAQLQRDAMTSANSEIGRLTSSLQGKNSDVYAANRETGATDKLGILNRLNAESLGLGYARETIPLQLQNQVAGQGVTDRGLAPIQTAQLRNNAIQLASNAYQSAIARNDYETAKVKADEIVANKYDGILAEIEAKKTNLENIKYTLSGAEKKVAEATTARLKKEEADIAERKANEKSIGDLVVNASSQGAPQELRDKAMKAKTPMEAANILGVYAGDYLKNELLKEQIKTAQSSRAISQQKADGVNLTGKPLKVSNAEITDLNASIVAKNSINNLITQYKDIISRTGTQTLYGKDAGDRDSIKTSILFAMKNLEKTGALDKGSTDVLAGNIPDSKFLNTETGQTAKLDSLLNTVNSKTDEYISSYKGTSAETDPRTKRAYEKAGSASIVIPQGVSSSGASYAQSTMSSVDNVNNQVNTQQSYSGYDTGIK